VAGVKNDRRLQEAEAEATTAAPGVAVPVKRGSDDRGPFYRWGDSGKRYRYTPGNEASRKRARDRAVLQGRAAQSKAPASDTKAKNKAGSAATASGKITISAATDKALRDKAAAYNADAPEGRKIRAGTLRSVYRRGAGAFSSSHSPRVTSRAQWAMARVNAFLRLVKTGRPRNAKYTTDNDLLPTWHKRSRPRNAKYTTDNDLLPTWHKRSTRRRRG
jgi:hypothetical protein